MGSVSHLRRWRLVVGIMILSLFAIPAAGIVVGATTPFQQVIVTNPEESPIPVSLTGSNAISGTVTVGNLPATQPVSGTVNVGNSPTVQLASDSIVAVVNPTDDQPLLVQEVASATPSPAEILPPTGNTIIGPARLQMDSVGTYPILRGTVSLDFCITVVLLDANGYAEFQANPTSDSTWYGIWPDGPLARCEASKQNANIDNHVAGTALVYRIDRIP